MKRFYSRIFSSVIFCLLLPACSRDGAEKGASIEEASGEQPTNRIDIPSTVRNNLGITFAEVERRNVANTIRVPGSFEWQPLARHEYRLMLSGRVEFAVNQFNQVEPGAVLYRVRSLQWRELQAQIDLAVAALDQSRAKYEAAQSRVETLAKASFKRADLEAQAVELKADAAKREAELQAILGSAARTLSLHGAPENTGFTTKDLLTPVAGDDGKMPLYQTIDWIEVRAKEPGIVEALEVTDGSFVEETTLVVTTVDPGQVRFRAMGLQSDLTKFESDRPARIVPPQAKDAEINEAVEAELTIGLSANPDHRTVTLFATPIEQRIWTRAGVSAFLEIVTESSSGPVLAIPRSAVVKDGITHVFFKRDPLDANKAIRVEADLGVDDGRWVEVRSGVGPNDEVVLNGAYELKLATAVSGTIQKGGHFHADGTYHGDH